MAHQHDLRHRIVNTRTILTLGALGAVLFGYENGIVAGAILFIPRDIPLGPAVEGLVVSSAVLGAMLGALGSGPFSDRWGRQRLLVLAGGVFAVGALGAALAPGVPLLVASRVLLGVAIGICSVGVPLFLAEMAGASARGVVTSLNQYMIVIGTGLAGGVGWLLSFSGSWRWMFLLGLFPAVVLLLGMLAMPDTPRSLVHRGRNDEAREVLEVLRGDPRVAEEELHDIRQLDEEESRSSQPVTRLRDPWVRRLLLLGIGLAVFQQVTGINAVVYYSPSVLSDLGLSQSSSLLFSFLNGMLNIATIAVVVRLHVVDRRGRKPMLLVGLLALTASLLVIGLGNLLTADGSQARVWLTIVGFVAFTNTFSATWGPVLWVVLAEIFPLRVRATAVSVATLFNWLAAFVVSQTFPVLQAAVGAGAVLVGFAVIGAVLVPVVARTLPETKGRSLEDLERSFRDETAVRG